MNPEMARPEKTHPVKPEPPVGHVGEAVAEGELPREQRIPPKVLPEFARRDEALMAQGVDLSPAVYERDPGIAVTLNLGGSPVECKVVNLAHGTPYKLWDVQDSSGNSVTSQMDHLCDWEVEYALMQSCEQDGGWKREYSSVEGWAQGVGRDLCSQVERRPAVISGGNEERASQNPDGYMDTMLEGLGYIVGERGGPDNNPAAPLTARTLEVTLPYRVGDRWLFKTFAVAYFDAGDGKRWHGVDVNALPASKGKLDDSDLDRGPAYRKWDTTAELMGEVLSVATGKGAQLGTGGEEFDVLLAQHHLILVAAHDGSVVDRHGVQPYAGQFMLAWKPPEMKAALYPLGRQPNPIRADIATVAAPEFVYVKLDHLDAAHAE